jgi:hypothetical protein
LSLMPFVNAAAAHMNDIVRVRLLGQYVTE